MDPNSPDRNFEVAGDHQTDEGPLDLNLVTSGNKGVVHEEGKMGTLNSEEDSSPAKADIYHDENERGASFDKLPSSAENENFHIEVEDADSALSLQESFFGVNVNSEHCQGGLEKENYTQKSHELPFIDEPAEVHTGDLSGSRQFEGQDFYHENGDERNDDNHTEKNEDFYSGKQQRNNEENGPGDSDLYYRQGFQKRLASPVAKERSVTPEMASQVKVSRLEEMSSDVNHTIRSPYSDISPRRECSPSPRSPDGGHRRSPSQDRASPLKRRKSSPARIPLRDSDQRIYSPRRSFSPERTPRRDSGNPVNSPSKRLSISPSRQDSPQKHDSPQKLDSVRWQGSPQRNGSPKRQDSPRRQDLPRRGDSPRKRGSPQKRDSPQRQDSPERRDSPGNNSPRKRLSASPRRRDSSQRRGRSISQSPPGRRDSSGYKRNRHDKPRSRSPYGQDLHRRSPRRRHSPRRRSPYSGHSRRHSPRRRPWSPPSNRSTGIGRPGKNLFVAGFSFVTTERDLERKFSRYGHVTDVRIVRDKRSGDSRGFGFLSLERDEEADAAIRALDQTEWNGRIVLVEKAKTSVR